MDTKYTGCPKYWGYLLILDIRIKEREAASMLEMTRDTFYIYM